MLDASPRLLPSALFGVAVVAVAAAAWFAWAQPGFEAPFGPLPGMRNAANLSFLSTIVAVLLVLAPVWIGGHAKGSSFIGGPFVAIAVGCVVLNLVLLGVMIRVADLLTRVSFNAANAPSGVPAKPVVYVYEVIGRSTPYLTLVPLACLLGFAIYELIGYWRAGVDPTVRADIRAWYSQHPLEEPTTEPGWHHSALTDDEVKRRGLAGLLDRVRGRGWEAGVARARRFAQMPRDLDKLLALIAGLGLLILAWAEVSIWVLEYTAERHRMDAQGRQLGRYGAAVAGTAVASTGVGQPRKPPSPRHPLGRAHLLAPRLPSPRAAVVCRTRRPGAAAAPLAAPRKPRTCPLGRPQPGQRHRRCRVAATQLPTRR